MKRLSILLNSTKKNNMKDMIHRIHLLFIRISNAPDFVSALLILIKDNRVRTFPLDNFPAIIGFLETSLVSFSAMVGVLTGSRGILCVWMKLFTENKLIFVDFMSHLVEIWCEKMHT